MQRRGSCACGRCLFSARAGSTTFTGGSVLQIESADWWAGFKDGTPCRRGRSATAPLDLLAERQNWVFIFLFFFFNILCREKDLDWGGKTHTHVAGQRGCFDRVELVHSIIIYFFFISIFFFFFLTGLKLAGAHRFNQTPKTKKKEKKEKSSFSSSRWGADQMGTLQINKVSFVFHRFSSFSCCSAPMRSAPIKCQN